MEQPTNARRRRNRHWVRIVAISTSLAVLAVAFLFFWNNHPLLDNATGLLSTFSPNTPVDEASGSDVGETAWNLILVNNWNPIPKQYKVELTQLSNGETIDTRIYPALQELFNAARADGIYPVVVSGYRTTESQQQIMDEKIAAYEAEGYTPSEAKTEAEAWVAIPGTSEHQLGIAADINADGIHSYGEEVYDWLNENGHRFGFIRRYPPDKTDVTGISHEPWHYRYVGIDAATEIYRKGLCLEEYLKK